MRKEAALKLNWHKILNFLQNKFNEGQSLDIEGVIYLIGLQELGEVDSMFKKDEKNHTYTALEFSIIDNSTDGRRKGS